jgi:SAM-dependent methyltransferase
VSYAALAPIYDRVMAHVDYEQWVWLIRRVCDRFAEGATPAILELGGGTGVLAQRLIAEGYSYAGSDVCFDMCREAVARRAPFACVDARRLAFRRRFGMIIFLYDGINYLLSKEEYQRLFAEVHGCLEPGGLFLFDITTQSNSLAYFLNRYECEDFDTCYCIRHSHYDRASSIQYNDFTLFYRDPERSGCFMKQTDHHGQKVLPHRTIRSWVPRELFSVEGTWDGFSFHPAHRHSERIHFLLRKK